MIFPGNVSTTPEPLGRCPKPAEHYTVHDTPPASKAVLVLDVLVAVRGVVFCTPEDKVGLIAIVHYAEPETFQIFPVVFVSNDVNTPLGEDQGLLGIAPIYFFGGFNAATARTTSGETLTTCRLTRKVGGSPLSLKSFSLSSSSSFSSSTSILTFSLLFFPLSLTPLAGEGYGADVSASCCDDSAAGSPTVLLAESPALMIRSIPTSSCVPPVTSQRELVVRGGLNAGVVTTHQWSARTCSNWGFRTAIDSFGRRFPSRWMN